MATDAPGGGGAQAKSFGLAFFRAGGEVETMWYLFPPLAVVWALAEIERRRAHLWIADATAGL